VSLFEKLRDSTGLKLLQKFGDTFRISKESTGTFSASTGTYTITTTTQDVVGKSFSLQSQFADPELVRTDDIEVYVTASGITFAPQEGMTIQSPVSTGEKYKIFKAEPIPQSGTVVMYRIMARL